MRRLLRIAALIAGSAGLAVGVSAQRRTTTIFVTVVNQAGDPIVDLAPSDFELLEGGEKRPIVRAALSREPMRIALLVDTSEEAKASINHIRNGLNAFLDAIPPQNEIVLVSTGGQARVRVQPTTDHQKLKAAMDSLFADGGTSVVLDALRESYDRFLRRVENRWPVFVVLTTDGPDSSATRDNQLETFIRDIRDVSATAHAIVLSSTNQSYRNAKAWAGALDVVRFTGGHAETLAVGNALPARMKALGDLIADQQRQLSMQYEVDFVRQSTDPDTRVIVNVARDGAGIGLAVGRSLK
jgi:hypothetical protein